MEKGYVLFFTENRLFLNFKPKYIMTTQSGLLDKSLVSSIIQTIMQPHSMCALGMAGYVWGGVEVPCPSSASMKVIYQDKYHYYKTNVYYLSNIKEDDDHKRMSVDIVRGGGGIACTITITRRSAEEGAEIEMTHSQQHVSGLREVSRISHTQVSEGRHYNSMKYGDFSGKFTQSDRKRMQLMCDIKRDDGSFMSVQYTLEITI